MQTTVPGRAALGQGRHSLGTTWPTVLGLAVVGVYLVAFGWSMQHQSYDIWGAYLVAPVLMLLTVPLARHAQRLEPGSTIGRTLLIAFAVKLAASVLHYVVVGKLYPFGDLFGYHDAGLSIYEPLRHGNLHVVLPPGYGLTGTGLTWTLTGCLYLLTGPTLLGGMFLSSWIAFLGLYLFYRAFRIAVPDGDSRRYARLVFFLPSLLFWTSSTGKEPWMLLGLGLVAYGLARAVTGQRGGVVALAVGLACAGLVRAHVALIATPALVAAFAVTPSSALRRGRASKAAGAVLVVVGVAGVAVAAVRWFSLDGFSPSDFRQLLAHRDVLTTSGGPSDLGQVPSVLQLPKYVVTVLFRPFPWEARSLQLAASAFESAVLVGIFAMSVRRVLTVPRRLLHDPYVTYAVVFTLVFAFAFSSVTNYGILARERAQLLPLLLVILAVPPVVRSGKVARRRVP